MGRFLLSDAQLESLRSTRAGRFTLAGYNYQCSYAVSRLASMMANRPLPGLRNWPILMRYDWGEDLDEVCNNNEVWFTQCKRVDDISEPTSLSRVMLGFAPKLLWTPAASRERIHFRLVCTDKKFLAGGRLNECRSIPREGIATQFVNKLEVPPGAREDRASWQELARSCGHENLFDTLWSKVFVLHLGSEEIGDDPAGRLLTGERNGLDLLLCHGHLSSARQAEALGRLRRIIHDNLIEFDPTSHDLVEPPSQSPRVLDRGDVAAALFVNRPRSASLPFRVVDRAFLSEQRQEPKTAFVGRPPEWRDVVHGCDDRVKFVDRDQTQQLREDVHRKLLQPITQGASDFPCLFVSGAPGAGKSALVRRIAALLVEEGAVVVADAGLNLGPPPDDPDIYCQRLAELADTGRTVLLVLDDPLFEESSWIDLLYKLKRPGLRVTALAASSQFLFDRFKGHLAKLKVHTFNMAGASRVEKSNLARLHGRDVNSFGTDTDDFLVLSMEAATGVPLDTIMDRLWLTLNGGIAFDRQDSALESFPWPLRAFLIVCLFHRLHVPCPEPLLQVVLELSGGTCPGTNVRDALDQMRHADGWKIFRFSKWHRANWAYQGSTISTSHQHIALGAWERRPMPWLEHRLYELLGQALVRVPQTARQVAIAAGRLATDPMRPDNRFVDQLISVWSDAGSSASVETRCICELVGMLQLTGCAPRARVLTKTLQSRTKPGPDGWLAALALWFLSSDDAKKRSFPPHLDLKSLVETGDFSIAPRRAVVFGNLLRSKSTLLEAFWNQLLKSLDGELPWKPDSLLMTWLLANGPSGPMSHRLDAIRRWLTDCPENATVRTQFLSFLLRLPKEFDDQRRGAAAATAKWLVDHVADTVVRTQYLSFLQQSPQGEPFDRLRSDAAEQTAVWLRQPGNDLATDVRTQFLSFLSGLPEGFSQLRLDTALETSAWLEAHPENSDVRGQYVSFVLDLPGEGAGELRRQSESHHRFLIGRDSSNYGRYYAYGELLLSLERYGEAEEHFRETLKRHKGHQLAHLGLARAMHSLGRYDDAEAEYRHAIWWAGFQQMPQARFWTSLGWFYIERSRWIEAITAFKHAQSERTEYFGNHWGIGKAMKELGRFTDAEWSLRKALGAPDLKPPACDEIRQLLDEVLRQRDSSSKDGI